MHGRFPDADHKENFVACIRSRKLPNADIREGHLSTLLAQMANISYRLGGQKLIFDSKTETFTNSPEGKRVAQTRVSQALGRRRANMIFKWLHRGHRMMLARIGMGPYRLLPYIYSAAHEAARTGMPLARAMPLVFPDDRQCDDLTKQWLLGPWLLTSATVCIRGRDKPRT